MYILVLFSSNIPEAYRRPYIDEVMIAP